MHKPSNFCASSSQGILKNSCRSRLEDNSFSHGVIGGSSNWLNSSFIICKSTTALRFPLAGLEVGLNSSSFSTK